MVEPWSERFEVRPEATDPGGRLSIVGLCDSLQEAAARHAVELGISIGDLGRDNLTWVLGRLRLHVDALPPAGAAIDVTTWPSRLRSYFVLRDFLVESAGGGVLARATSTWFVIDLARRRAVRIPAAIQALRPPACARALSERSPRLEPIDAPDRHGRFEIGEGDLDVNVHVNHVRYLEWALATLEREFFDRRRPAELEIDFLAELTLGDSVTTEAQIVPDGDSTVVRFSVREESSRAEAARIRSRWLDGCG